MTQNWDMGGSDLIVNTVSVGATTPGQAGTSLSGAELTVLDGVTAGTAAASKALVLNSSKGISTVTSATITTLTATDVNTTNVTATGAVVARSGVSVPATAGAVAAGAPITMFSNKIWVTSDAPTHTATKGDLCINTGGSSSSTRLYVNNGTTTWIAVTTAS